MARTAVGVLLALGFLAAVVLVTRGQVRVRCEVCMRHDGRQACAEARAADRAQAQMQATSAACAQLSGGVTDGIRCNRTPPLSAECSAP